MNECASYVAFVVAEYIFKRKMKMSYRPSNEKSESATKTISSLSPSL